MTEMALARVFVRLPYRDHAACVGEDPGLFFPEPGDHVGIDLARSICRRCPVAQECLDDNLREPQGIYGGLTGKERKRLRVELGVKRQPAACGTNAGHHRHLDLGEAPCDPCREARNEYQRAYRAERAS